MQPEQTAPAPAIQPAPVAVPVAPLVGGSAPDRTMMIHTGLVLAALLLALLGVMGDAWYVAEGTVIEDDTELTVEYEIGLDEHSASACFDLLGASVCSTEKDTYGSSDLRDAYDNCTSQAEAEGDNESQIEESCGGLGDMASAGFAGVLFITIGILALIATLVATFMGTRGTTLPFSQYYPFGGAAFTLIGFVAWLLMMPTTPIMEQIPPSLGSNAWMIIVSTTLAAGAGGYTMYTGTSTSSAIVDTSAPGSGGREPGIGARSLASDSEAREFVLRETALGNQTLSIVEDGHLFRLTRATRSEEGTHSEDLFMTRLDALIGFTHERFDWLDSTRYLWNVMAIVGLGLSIFTYDNFHPLMVYSDWYILLFATGTILSLMQFADPELITFETNTGKHRTLIYRAGSNRVLTNTSMELIDSVMRDTLRGEQIDPTALNAVADSIEAEMAEARRAAEEAVAAQQAALLQAQAEAQAQAQAQMEMQAQMQAQAQAQAEAQAQAMTQAQMQAQQATAIPPSPAVAPAAPPPVAVEPAPVPPVMNPPPAPAATPAPPPVATPPPAPMPPPAGATNPLPPLPSNLDPNLVAEMDMPTEAITPAPEIPMQAAPRDDSLSEGEKENILTDLGED